MNDSQMKTGVAEVGHTHADVSGGALRASVFGGMDGLVTNIALVAGVGAAGASASLIVLTGVAGLVAGAFSMAMGEYTSVKTQNEQLDREWVKEREEIDRHPAEEERELASMFRSMGMSKATAATAARDVHSDVENAALVHVTQELGLDPRDKPSPRVAAVSSFITFSTGALVPLIPYLLGFTSLVAALAMGGLGLLVAGALASLTTVMPWWLSALRQLGFGALAAGATYLVGLAMGISVVG
ncbi:MAG TPA: VIT1/CCC1 transporter family protein [Microlunatus sp.]|jgi:VIT1/CCC1 family predicted Fe2+/Mn2+ transporter